MLLKLQFKTTQQATTETWSFINIVSGLRKPVWPFKVKSLKLCPVLICEDNWFGIYCSLIKANILGKFQKFVVLNYSLADFGGYNCFHFACGRTTLLS